MADSTVSALTAASALTGTELFYGVQSANDVKVTASQIATFTGGGGGGMAIGSPVTSGTNKSLLFVDGSGNLAQDTNNCGWDSSIKSFLIESQNALYRIPNAGGDNWFEGGAGNFTLSGHANFGTGTFSLRSLTTGSENVSLGFNTLASCLTGDANVAMGSSVLASLTSGQQNVGIGSNTLVSCNGNFNTGIGTSALNAVTTGGDNIGLGASAGLSITSGARNLAMGTNALRSLVGEQDNIGVGYGAFRKIVGNFNTAIGSQTGVNITAGSWNTVIGMGSMSSCVGGDNNTIISSFVGGGTINNVIMLTDGNTNFSNSAISGVDFNYTISGVWSFQKGTTKLGLHVYNTTDGNASPTNYERGVFDWNVNSNILTIGTQAGGTGVKRLTAIDGFAKAGAPAAGDLPSGSFALIDDTSGGQTWLCFNKAGTIRKVQLV